MEYRYKELKFEDFTSRSSYNKLKIYFRILSVNQPFPQELDLLDAIRDFNIKERVTDHHGNIYDTDTSFLADFVIPNIKMMSIQHYNKFQKDIEEKSLYSKDSLQNYSKSRINEYLKWSEEIDKAEYLDVELKNLVAQQLQRLIQDVENHIKYPTPYFEGKLKFNWKKADVLYFFHLLRENKIIENLSNTAYARIIDNLVEYREGENFRTISDSRKRLSAFNQQTPTVVAESKKRLINIFKSPDFYKE